MATPETTWITTSRLVLRRPTAADLGAYVRLHTDPRTYTHAPDAMPDEQRCRERLDEDLASWERDGVGYAAVLARESGRVIGWAGLRVVRDAGEPHFNLYYRLAHDELSAGFGREVARAVTAWALEYRPDVPVQAAVDPGNDRSIATARAAGLLDIGMSDPGEGAGNAMHLLRAPVVDDVPAGEAPVDDLIDLWIRVNDAGGAVGFLPGAPRDEVRAALRSHLDAVEAGRARLVALRGRGGDVRGFGFWEHSGDRGFAHVAVLKRLMVDPVARGCNWGALLLAGMVGIARRDLPGVSLLLLDYRSGLGLGDFYARHGWAEVGRVPGGIEVGDDDYRDDVFMARRVDGGSLTADGRT